MTAIRPGVDDGLREPAVDDARAVVTFLLDLEGCAGALYRQEPTDRRSLDPFIYSDRVGSLIQALCDHGFVQPVDYIAWSDEAARYSARPELIDRADLATLVYLFTTHVRVDRFVAGHLASVLDDGTLARMLRRVGALFGVAPPVGQ